MPAAPMPAASVEVRTHAMPGVPGALRSELMARLASGELRVHVEVDIPFSVAPAELVPPGLTVTRSSRTATKRVCVAEGHGVALIVSTSEAATFVTLFGVDEQVVDELWEEVNKRLHSSDPGSGSTTFRVWSHENHGPVATASRTHSAEWASMSRNYPRSTRRTLEHLMSYRPTPQDGRLLLWHGPPGTGKTSAALALMSTWASWADPHVITDPEMFFSQPNYLMTVLNQREAEVPVDRLPTLRDKPSKRWKLIVCEDADEYLRTDARHRSGPALGRLLNATDGILGRDADAIVLLTTNDDVSRLHPALTRPGRCLETVNFPALTRAEATAWCPPGVAPPGGSATLAELFALVSTGRPVETSEAMGLYL